MPPDSNKIATDCYKKGNEAMLKENWDYAIDMYTKAVRLVPDNLLYRQALRGVEGKKYKGNKTGAKMAGLRLTGIRTRISRAKMKSDWNTIDQAAEDGLTLNPWDAQLNADLGEACRNLGYSEVALFCYRTAVDNDGTNKAFLVSLAELHELRGNYTEAIDCWKRVAKLDPLDSQARSKMTQLEAMNVMDRGGYEGAQSTIDVKTGYDFDRPAKTVIPEAVSGPGASPEADLQRAIRKNPADKNNYLKLADLYTRERRLADAYEVLKKGLEASGGDPNVRELLEDNELEQLRHNMALARQNAETDATANRNYHEIKQELRKREIEVFSGRVERYPKDSRWKYALANLHMKTKEWKKAIPLLQQSVADVRLKGEVLVALAKCFVAEKNHLLASRQLEQAVQVINPHDKTELFAEAHYILARICEENGQVEAAETHYNEVLGVDYDFRDARERMEKLQLARKPRPG